MLTKMTCECGNKLCVVSGNTPEPDTTADYFVGQMVSALPEVTVIGEDESCPQCGREPFPSSGVPF